MNHLGIEISVKHMPELDPGFLPLGKFFTAFLADAKQPLDVAVERSGGEVAVYKTFIHGTPEMEQADIVIQSAQTAHRPCRPQRLSKAFTRSFWAAPRTSRASDPMFHPSFPDHPVRL